MQKFWIVICEGATKVYHKDYMEQGARDEAERLAKMNPGKVFDVLVLVDTCKKTDVMWWNEFRNELPTKRLRISGIVEASL